jgi:hypothetical protein
MKEAGSESLTCGQRQRIGGRNKADTLPLRHPNRVWLVRQLRYVLQQPKNNKWPVTNQWSSTCIFQVSGLSCGQSATQSSHKPTLLVITMITDKPG